MLDDIRYGRGQRDEALKPWASAHAGKWGQLTSLEKWMKN